MFLYLVRLDSGHRELVLLSFTVCPTHTSTPSWVRGKGCREVSVRCWSPVSSEIFYDKSENFTTDISLFFLIFNFLFSFFTMCRYEFKISPEAQRTLTLSLKKTWYSRTDVWKLREKKWGWRERKNPVWEPKTQTIKEIKLTGRNVPTRGGQTWVYF